MNSNLISQPLQGQLGGPPSSLAAGGWALRGAVSRPLPTVPAVPCQQLWLLLDSGNMVPPPPRPHPGGISLGDMGGQERQVAKPKCMNSPELLPHPSAHRSHALHSTLTMNGGWEGDEWEGEGSDLTLLPAGGRPPSPPTPPYPRHCFTHNDPPASGTGCSLLSGCSWSASSQPHLSTPVTRGSLLSLG